MKILIADDDLTFRKLMERYLTTWGYEVEMAEDGNQAWKILESRERPSLAVIDWMMPGMDGLEICRRLRKQNLSKPVYAIIVTARESKADVIEGLDAGADDYLVKPVDIGELQARVNVGRRILELQAELAEKEKLQGIVEMSGNVCHDMNQPLQVVSGTVELMMMEITTDHPFYERLQTIKEETDKMGKTTLELMSITYLPAMHASAKNMKWK